MEENIYHSCSDLCAGIYPLQSDNEGNIKPQTACATFSWSNFSEVCSVKAWFLFMFRVWSEIPQN